MCIRDRSTTAVTTSILTVLSNLGLSYTHIQTDEFTTVNFDPYGAIVVGMDGGTISEASVAALANAASSGKNLIMIGGSNLTSYYTGMKNYLLRHTNQTGWQTSIAPHGRVVDASNPLAKGYRHPIRL
jgi:hypothetical protein